MSVYKKLSEEQILKQYQMIKDYYDKYLREEGVCLPKLKNKNGAYTKDALVLVYLSLDYPKTEEVTKTELTQFIRDYYPDVNDVQQARHLGAQKGWWIVAGGRDNIVLEVPRGAYRLYTLERSYPAFHDHRITDTGDWGDVKQQYGHRCVTCGSKEGQPNFHWPETKTKLQKSHMDPNKPLIYGNIIPQCQKCNRADRNRWVYDERGRVIKLAKPSFIKNSDRDVRWKVYCLLHREFKGKNPYGKK